MRGTRAFIALALMAPLLCAAPAHAFVYWGGGQSQTIGRAANNGGDVEASFIHTGLDPTSVAVDSGHIYWANEGSDSIGRAKIDGTEANNSFITGIDAPSGVAIDGTSIFWSSISGDIGRASIDGSNVDKSLIPTAACGIAVDSGHIYWASVFLADNYIGRAPLSGNPPYEDTFVTIPGTSSPCGVAVNAANIFWANFGLGGGSEIGRASATDGTFPDPSAIGDAAGPCGVALDSGRLYWANSKTGDIGRANTDATDDEENFIVSGSSEICGVAADDLAPLPPAPSGGSGNGGGSASAKLTSKLHLGAVRLDKRRGTALLAAMVGGPGKLTLSGKGLVRRQDNLGRAGPARLTLRAAGKAKAKLGKSGAAKVRAIVTFSQAGDSPTTLAKGILLRETLG
jgi:streptogramin lyase